MDELKQLFQELFIILEENGDRSYDPQMKILKRVLKIIDGDENDLDKFSQVACEYEKLFFPKSGLSEFYIWKDNFAERKKKNDTLEFIKKRLWEIFG